MATIRALASDRSSGAAEIAARAAEVLAGLSVEEAARSVRTLLRGHPSMAPLWRLATEVLRADHPRRGVESYVAYLASDREAARSIAGDLPDRVLTISYSSTVLEAIRVRRPGEVVCMASRPGGEGHRMARAAGRWVRTRVIEDEGMLAGLPGDAVLVGADAVTPEALVNKVKTRRLVEAASAASIPRYSVAGPAKFIAEMLPVGGPFEATPLGLFSGIGTAAGVVDAASARGMAVAAAVHPSLRPLLPPP